MSSPNYQALPLRVHGPEGLSSPRPRPTSKKRKALVLATVFVTLATAAPAAGSLKAKLDRALVARGVSSSQTGAIVYDRAQSRFVYRHNSLLALRPASNEKLPVAVTALSVLGPTFKIPTELHAEGHLAAGGVWRGRLILAPGSAAAGGRTRPVL